MVYTIITQLSNQLSSINLLKTSLLKLEKIILLKSKQNKTLQFYKSDLQDILNDATFIYKYIISNNIAESFMKIEANTVNIETCNLEDAKSLGCTNLSITKDQSKEKLEIILTLFFLLKKYNIDISL